MSNSPPAGKYTACKAAAGIVAHVDLTLGERAIEALHAHREALNGRLRGVRQRTKWHEHPVVRGAVSADRPHLYLEPAFGRGLDALAGLGLTLDASIYHSQLDDMLALARAHPQASIVLIHSGSPVGQSIYAHRHDQVHREWLAGMKELAKCPNVSVKMGGLLMCLGNFSTSGLRNVRPRRSSSHSCGDRSSRRASNCSAQTDAWLHRTFR